MSSDFVDAVEPLESIPVLHVDDDPDLADLTATYLEREDDRFDVTIATSVAQAVNLLQDQQYVCVVSDYDMPEQTGIEFLSIVREEYPDLPFILYTGKGSEEVASEAISSGVTDYLQKETGSGQYTVLANRIINAVNQQHATAALQDSQERLALLIEQSPIGVLEYNEEFEIVRLNETGESILGYSEEELLGETWEQIVAEDSYENVDRVTDDLSRAEGGFHSIDENVRKDGTRIYCEWHNRVITDADGDVVTIISLFQDITDRRERQRELERHKSYLEGSTDIITVVDEAGRIQYQSPSVTRILGYEAGELLGEDAFAYVHPDDTATAYAAFERLITSSEQRVSVEFRFRTADDEWRWLEIRGTDYRERPDIDGIVVNSRDITTRRQREQTLRQTTARLESLFDESPDMINVHDMDGNIIDPNPRLCEQTGYTEAELKEMKIWDLDQTIAPDEARSLWAGMEPNTQTKVTGQFRRKDGSEFPVEIHIRRHAIDGEQRFIVISRNISEQKQKERQLKEFASVVSHDLRNPLSVADGHLELAQETCDSDHLDKVAQAHDRMDGLIENILTLAQEGKQVSDIEIVSLGSIMANCWETVDTADATLRTVTESRIHADRERLRQLLENLIRNAIEHGGNTVTVTVGDLDDGFYVADDGPGIETDDQNVVFEAGYSSTEGGTGFGLSIARQIAEAHGWELSLTAGEDGGARFEITDVEIEK
ncbi:PAS domain S-box protein [Halomicroarcula sp. F13]|uniref:histidine kinase n=1 Tax=Haloarcula rubra TaxID=2487747 RepID=A0AAW4PWU2_9EURY|nr:PAS domain S-box protein [Halomicroarcula rubra]MBX0325119.1 PAS domain S-box protein [Halomicroarcula rubra]